MAVENYGPFVFYGGSPRPAGHSNTPVKGREQMLNYNTVLSDTARKALERIRALRAVSAKTGLQTFEEQNRILLALENTDMLAVADALGKVTR